MKSNKNNEEDFDAIFNTSGKFNSTINISQEDKDAGIKVYCQEPYAQDLYDAMKAHESRTGISTHACKDLEIGEIYEVKATHISFDNKHVSAEEVSSRVDVIIPFNEYISSLDDLLNGENPSFNVMIIKNDRNCAFVGSEKDCVSINNKNELQTHFKENTWFEVKINKLIKGGYLVSYKSTVDCFLPGSHAGANVIRDFSKLLGSTINVMVDNYDKSNDLFILSYKKYIVKSMPAMVSELEFGKQYTGTLTTKPYDFGVFIEIDGYYTGLVHSSEFDDYNTAKTQLRAGDELDVYIKNVTKNGSQYRVVLTLDPESIDPEKKQWDDLRNRTKGESFDYEVDPNNSSIQIQVDDESFKVTLRKKDLQRNLNLYPKVRVSNVDPINKSIQFEFVENEG